MIYHSYCIRGFTSPAVTEKFETVMYDSRIIQIILSTFLMLINLKQTR